MIKKVIIKHVPTYKRMYEIEGEQVTEDIVKGIPPSRNTLELKDRIIHFVIWHNMGKVWDHINGPFGYGEIDFSEIDKEFEMMKGMAHLRRDLHQEHHDEQKELVNAD